MDELIGKFAYCKYGFYSHLIGKIEKNDNGITPYVLVTKMGTRIGFRNIDDIVFVEIENN
jgi:hypothetical protein